MEFFVFHLQINFTRAVRGEDQNFFYVFDPFLRQQIVEILSSESENGEIFGVIVAVVDDHERKRILRLLVILFRKRRKRAVCFVERVVDAVKREISCRAQRFDQVGHVQIVAFELVVVDSVFVDHDARLAADERFQGLDFQIEKGHDLVQNENRDDRDDPVQQRNGDVCHGNTRKFGNEQRDDKFERLHFADLAFPHQAHDHEQDDKDDRRANRYE